MRRRLHWLLAAMLVVMCFLLWRGSAVDSEASASIEPSPGQRPARGVRMAAARTDPRAARDDEAEEALVHDPYEGAPPPGETMSWSAWANDFLRPQPGESFIEYRDRMLPVAQALVAPHRRRVERRYQSAVAQAGLDEAQIDRIQAVIDGSEEALKERVLDGVLSGRLWGPGVSPMAGVEFAHGLLGVVVDAKRQVLDQLSEDEQQAFRDSGFDIAEYLLFSTRWEDLLGVTE